MRMSLLQVAAVSLLLQSNACVKTAPKMSRAQLEFHNEACAFDVLPDDPWHIRNLYDCANGTLYIPHQLWTASGWNGDKTAPCMHAADSKFWVDGVSETTIQGPKTWFSPRIERRVVVWHRVKSDGSKLQYFTCNDKGIGRVYDSRGRKTYPLGRCKFPAGFGWKLGKKRRCHQTAIQITSVSLSRAGRLKDLQFKWWVSGDLDHRYRYVPNIGMTNAWPL